MASLQPLPAASEPMTGADGKLTPRWRAWMQRADTLLAALDTAVTGVSNQPLDATLTALAGLATGADKVPYSTGTDTFGQLDFKDEDNMASDSATAVPSQQSTKAYATAAAATKQPIPSASNNFPVGTVAFLEYTATSTLGDGSTTTSVRHAVAYNDDAGTTTPLLFARGAGAVPGGTWKNVTGASLDGNGNNNYCYGTFVRTA